MPIYRDIASAAAAINEMHHLQECIIKEILWGEPAMRLTVRLDYIWTDDGYICFTKGPEPRPITLTFELTTMLMLNNALTQYMVEHPEELGWGISEIALFEIVDMGVGDANTVPGYMTGRFLWEGKRRIDVAFKALDVSFNDE